MTAFLAAYPWVPMLVVIALVIDRALLAVRAQQPKRPAITSERLDEESR